MKYLKVKAVAIVLLFVMTFVGCITEADRREYHEWVKSDDGPASGQEVSVDEFKSKYREGWRERAEAKRSARLEREALEREYKEWLASDDGPTSGKAVSVEAFKANYREGWRERAEAKKAARLVAEELRQERSALCDRIVINELAQIKKAYADREKYVNPFPRKDRRRSGEDWLKAWTGPRRDLSEEDKLAGDALLSEFGTKYLPNAYANYEKAREAALELQQVFNEEFPEPWAITSTSPKWSAFNKVLEKFAKVRTEYFLCRDELCHYWLAHRLGVLSAEDFAKIDSQRLAVQLLPVNVKLIGFLWLEITPMEAEYSEFAAKYAPESFAIYQKFGREFKEIDKLLEEVFKQRRQIDHVRFDRALRAAVSKRNDLVREMNMLLVAFQTWRSEHRTTVKSSEEVAQSDHTTALRLKPFLDSLPTYVKERALGPVIPKRDMIAIPGKYYRMQRTEVTQLQWMIVMGSNPSDRGGLPDNPVENVSWYDCKMFLDKLNAMPEVKASGLTFRLPTEKEWEYACRAGSTGDYCELADGTEITKSTLGEVAWYGENSDSKTHPVGQKKPNAFGLYDMHGNVWEWCEDLYRAGYSARVGRGGSWNSIGCAAGYRGHDDPGHRSGNLGFRLAAEKATRKEKAAAPISSLIRDMIAIPGESFKMGKYEVTQAQWQAVMGENPSEFNGVDHPVEQVSWYDCKMFLDKLNAMPEVKASGLTFRLPTEKEWEYACRAGSTGDYCKLADGTEITESTLGEVAWYDHNSDSKTHPVGQKKPNAFGLYDMHGNVWEWCEDLYRAGYSARVSRGGGWYRSSRSCAAGNRGRYGPGYRSDILGFRLAASQDVNR